MVFASAGFDGRQNRFAESTRELNDAQIRETFEMESQGTGDDRPFTHPRAYQRNSGMLRRADV